jgi:hypothetical protein
LYNNGYAAGRDGVPERWGMRWKKVSEKWIQAVDLRVDNVKNIVASENLVSVR